MYWLSKLLVALLHPLIWIILLLLFTLLGKNLRTIKIRASLTLALALIFSNAYLVQFAMARYQYPQARIPANRVYEAGILPGGFVSYDQKNKVGYFNTSADRFIQALRLWHLGVIRKIIVTGAHNAADEGFVETGFIARQLKENGVPDSGFILEPLARNTRQNAVFTRRIADSFGLKGPYLLISSAFHMRRAMKEYENAGLKTDPYACAYLVPPGGASLTFRSLLPAAGTMDQWQILFKEWIGLAVASWRRN